MISAGCGEDNLVELGQLLDLVLASDAQGASYVPRAHAIEAVRKAGDVTIFKSVGVGLQDVAIACAVVDRAIKEGIGRSIDDYDQSGC